MFGANILALVFL